MLANLTTNGHIFLIFLYSIIIIMDICMWELDNLVIFILKDILSPSYIKIFIKSIIHAFCLQNVNK
jgi:hypothetical protein